MTPKKVNPNEPQTAAGIAAQRDATTCRISELATETLAKESQLEALRNSVARRIASGEGVRADAERLEIRDAEDELDGLRRATEFLRGEVATLELKLSAQQLVEAEAETMRQAEAAAEGLSAADAVLRDAAEKLATLWDQVEDAGRAAAVSERKAFELRDPADNASSRPGGAYKRELLRHPGIAEVIAHVVEFGQGRTQTQRDAARREREGERIAAERPLEQARREEQAERARIAIENEKEQQRRRDERDHASMMQAEINRRARVSSSR